MSVKEVGMSKGRRIIPPAEGLNAFASPTEEIPAVGSAWSAASESSKTLAALAPPVSVNSGSTCAVGECERGGNVEKSAGHPSRGRAQCIRKSDRGDSRRSIGLEGRFRVKQDSGGTCAVGECELWRHLRRS